MKIITMTMTFLLLLPLGVFAQEAALSPERIASTVILDDVAVQNLQLTTEMVEQRDFETTVFAIGRIEEIPARRYSVSSRIAGRAIEIKAFEGDSVKKDQVLARVESRQPGNPPPTIELKALADGLVVNSHVLTGKPVDPDMDLLDIADRSEMWAIAKITEQEAAKIQLGMKARIIVPALGNEIIESTLFRYGVTADREAGTVEGVFLLSNAGGRLLPGMRAEFSIVVDHRENVLSAPRAAVQGDPARRVMYVKDFELPHAFIRSPVVLGKENDQYIEVISGLFLGDEVVTRGSYSLGFVGSGAGPSLKEALDAAHGHEHNEDGSELSADQNRAAEGDEHAHEEGGHTNRLLLVYAVVVTALLFLSRKSKSNAKAT